MRYNALNPHLKNKFGGKVYKVSIDIATTCPNRDGTRGTGGCIFCNPDSSVALISTSSGASIAEQLSEGIEYIRSRHGAKKFISYFLQHTNTYGKEEDLETYYRASLNHPDVVGVAISTRPDCIPVKMQNILEKLSRETYLWVELGLQSARNDMLEFLNRGHTVEDFVKSAVKLSSLGINVSAHVILGLPGETEEDLLALADLINKCGVSGIKIHNLHVLKDTPLHELYDSGSLKLLTADEYTKRVVFLLEHLKPAILIHRFNSHSPKRLTVAPDWSVNKLATFNAVEAELLRQDTFQGKKYKQ